MIELLNNITHKDLRIITRRGAQWGDDRMSAPVTLQEFRRLQADYPIIFQQDEKGAFIPVVLFGLESGENLFLNDSGWDAEYIPLAMQRQPFSIGVQGDEMRIMVEMESKRISQGPDGEAVFLPHGGTTDYIEEINSILSALHEGLQQVPDFIQTLQANDLLESFVLDVERPDGAHSQLLGYYMINEEKLAALSGETVGLLHEAGHLQNIYMSIASLSNLSKLIRWKLAREYPNHA
ncbi:SapC family protein [Roseateles paludis]|uniref:SapC family protein n=1 Tax=Roseateles paludis TaxID=3145238 RepID=A0ABV0G3C9_9BURK